MLRITYTLTTLLQVLNQKSPDLIRGLVGVDGFPVCLKIPAGLFMCIVRFAGRQAGNRRPSAAAHSDHSELPQAIFTRRRLKVFFADPGFLSIAEFFVVDQFPGYVSRCVLASARIMLFQANINVLALSYVELACCRAAYHIYLDHFASGAKSKIPGLNPGIGGS